MLLGQDGKVIHMRPCHQHISDLSKWFAGSNVVSVAEHVVMMMLSLVRNYMPAHKQICDGDWNVAEIARK